MGVGPLEDIMGGGGKRDAPRGLMFETGWPEWPGRLLFIFGARNISHPQQKRCSRPRVGS